MTVIGLPTMGGEAYLAMLACSLLGLFLLVGVKRAAVTLAIVGFALVPLLWAQPFYYECGPWWQHILEPWCLWR